MANRSNIRSNMADNRRGSNNQYNVLPVDSNNPELPNHFQDMDTDDEVTSETGNQKSPKPPPIVVANLNIKEVQRVITSVKNIKNDVQYKLTDRDIRIHAKEESDYLLIKNHLQSHNFEFYTHPLQGEKKVKVCMYGLYEIETDSVKNELNKLGVITSEVKMMQPKESYNGDQRIYILYFKKSEHVRINELRNKIHLIK